MHPRPGPPPPLDPVRAAIDSGLHALAGLGGDLVAHANRIGAILWSPPRVVVTGRLKAGKSTVVNALIGAPVAETAALEATNVVTVFQDGAPSRAVAVRLDGTTAPLELRDGRGVLSAPSTEIAYIDRYLPSAAIRNLTLIDTPGLSTLTVANDAATRRVLIDGFEQTRTVSVDADAAVFLFDSTPRADEVAFLRSIGFTPLNTLGVLSRADGFGEGALGRRDPIEHANAHANLMAQRLADTVFTVVPVAGLLAETSHTGRLTEADARALRSVAGLDPFALVDLLVADDPAPLSAVERDRLLDSIGEYGVVHGRDIAVNGGGALNDWLAQRSGLATLRQILDTRLAAFAAIHRADRILRELDRLAYTHPARDQIRSIVHQVRSRPEMVPVLLAGSLRGMLAADPESPVVTELRTLLEAETPAQRVGRPAHAGHAEILAGVNERLAWVQGRQLSTATAAEDAALATLLHTYTTMRRGYAANEGLHR
ncbi:dynamin family protein [Aldersonia sp. NBC_00410]|uniref:dynamin family protein n=1 Tax=Aldersonia sp. NBC_00410 TaxID=2975954 RepID=UPI002254C89C|nr:dynamin family protein [Aldersonia sp. NBC_00410]MCX5044850.1 dynamin family protein [Aldersonia sp. NBC_00410]